MADVPFSSRLIALEHFLDVVGEFSFLVTPGSEGLGSFLEGRALAKMINEFVWNVVERASLLLLVLFVVEYVARN